MTPKRLSIILDEKRCKNLLIRLAVKARGSEGEKTMEKENKKEPENCGSCVYRKGIVPLPEIV